MMVKKLFTEHPKTVNETYFEHLCFALKFALRLLMAGICGIIHAFFPFVFKETASKQIYKIVKELKATGRWQAMCQRFEGTESE